MTLSDHARFQSAQAYFRLPHNQRSHNAELAEAGRWFEAVATLVIGQRVRGTRKSAAEEDDRINQVWALLLERLPRMRFDPARGAIADWLAKVVDRILIRFTWRRRRPAEPLPREADLPDRDRSVAVMQQELADELHAALAVLTPKLPPKAPELIEGHWLNGRPQKEVAAPWGLTENAASCRLRRAFEKLRQLLPLRKDEWPHLAEWIENHPVAARCPPPESSLRREQPGH